MNAADIAAYVGCLGILGMGVWRLYEVWRAGPSREDWLSAREKEHDATIDRELEGLRSKNRMLERHLAALFAAVTVMVDRQITQSPFDPALAALSSSLRQSYPTNEEMPPEMAMLLLRLDARPKEMGETK